MRRFGLLIGVFAFVLASGVGTASAFSGGGKKPSEASLIAWGSHYEASLGNNQAEANYNPGCCSAAYQVGIWHLGPVSVHDQITVNWHALPFARKSGFPVSLVFVENVDDYSWGSTFRYHESQMSLAGSGSARSEITVKNSSANDYLEFYSEADETDSQDFETYLYDFSVEAPRHYLSVSLGSVQKVATNGFIHATATLATGAPVPDGTGFTLTGTWSNGGIFTTTAASIAGQITFPLALPETAIGKSVTLVASSAATGEYQAATSSKLSVQITKPPAPPTPTPSQACTKARSQTKVLARKFRRQLKRAERARGRSRHRLLRKARATEHKFLAARAAKKAAC